MTEFTFGAALQLPTPWPIPQDAIFHSDRTRKGIVFNLIIRRMGFLTTIIINHRGEIVITNFQRIRLSGNGPLILFITHKNYRTKIYINSKELLSGNPFQYSFIKIKTDDVEQKFDELLYPDINSSSSSKYEEQIFIETIKDIDSKIKDPSWYAAIKAAGLLRLLCLDKNRLIDKANRNHRIRGIKYTVNDYLTEPTVNYSFHWMSLDPSRRPTKELFEVDLDTFLKIKCLYHNGTTVTVRDIISACANGEGGVHVGNAKGEKEGVFLKVNREFEITGSRPSTIALVDICRIVLNGLRPLITSITSQQTTN